MFNLILRGKLNTGQPPGINLHASQDVPAWSLALGRVAQAPSLDPKMPLYPGHSEGLFPGKDLVGSIMPLDMYGRTGS